MQKPPVSAHWLSQCLNLVDSQQTQDENARLAMSIIKELIVVPCNNKIH